MPSTCIGVRCILYLFTFASANQFIPPGIKAGLYGDVVGHSDFQLDLRPPPEATQDVTEALDAIMKLENVKRQAAEDDFAAEKQRMLRAEKLAIRDLVQSSFKPLMEKFASQ